MNILSWYVKMKSTNWFMGPIADRDIPREGGDLTRLGPKTTAKLLDVILLRSHLSITCNQWSFRNFNISAFLHYQRDENLPWIKIVQCISVVYSYPPAIFRERGSSLCAAVRLSTMLLRMEKKIDIKIKIAILTTREH